MTSVLLHFGLIALHIVFVGKPDCTKEVTHPWTWSWRVVKIPQKVNGIWVAPKPLCMQNPSCRRVCSYVLWCFTEHWTVWQMEWPHKYWLMEGWWWSKKNFLLGIILNVLVSTLKSSFLKSVHGDGVGLWCQVLNISFLGIVWNVLMSTLKICF